MEVGAPAPSFGVSSRGLPEISCRNCITPSPPPGLQKSDFFHHLLHLAPLFANLGAKMSKHRPRLPRKLHLGAKVFQHTSQNPPPGPSGGGPNLQNSSKSAVVLVVFTLRPFLPGSPPRGKIFKIGSKMVQVGPSRRQLCSNLAHLGTILAPR